MFERYAIKMIVLVPHFRLAVNVFAWLLCNLKAFMCVLFYFRAFLHSFSTCRMLVAEKFCTQKNSEVNCNRQSR